MSSGSSPPTALVPSSTYTSTSSSTTSKIKGSLSITILSAYDLLIREPPTHVSVQVGNLVTQTGPPMQRHKDRNSFKFHSALTLAAPLEALYAETAIVTVHYSAPSKQLQATYKLNQLTVQETTWLILQLHSNNNNSSQDELVRPTLRLQMTLWGPYRTEIATCLALANQWFGVMDVVEQTVGTWTATLPVVDAKWWLIPVVPILAVVVVTTPIWLGMVAVGLPLLLPLLVSLAMVAGGALVGLLVIYSSTTHGRMQLSHLLGPVLHTLLSTPTGQRLVYQTGSRPSPVQLAKTVTPTDMWHKLLFSLLIDGLGSASYIIPVAGEATDLAWAPIQTCLIMAMYDATSPNLKYLSVAEELLPFTDIVPSATLGWLMEFGLPWMQQQIGGVELGNNKSLMAVKPPETSHDD